jgi:hypothetical protein
VGEPILSQPVGSPPPRLDTEPYPGFHQPYLRSVRGANLQSTDAQLVCVCGGGWVLQLCAAEMLAEFASAHGQRPSVMEHEAGIGEQPSGPPSAPVPRAYHLNQVGAR